MNKINSKGFSLAELLIGLVIASILFLTVGVLSSISHRSFNKLNKEQQVYNDISYGFKLVQNKVRGSLSPITPGSQSGTWIPGEHFQIGSDIFGLRTNPSNPSEIDLVYDDGSPQKILSIKLPNDTIDLEPTFDGQTVTIRLEGRKNEIPFNIETTIFRRNS